MDPTVAALAYHGAIGILRLLHGMSVDSQFADDTIWP